jgi:hypothetical protein
MALELLEQLACGSKLMAEGAPAERRREEVISLLAVVSQQNRTLFKGLLRTHAKVIGDVMRLSPEKAAALQYSLKMTISMRRRFNSTCLNLWGFTFLPTEREQKKFEDDVCKNFTTEHLDRGTMLLQKSTKDPAPKYCNFAKVRDLSHFLAEEVKKAMEEKFEDEDSIANLKNKRYKDRIRVIFGGDKGGETTKVTAMLGGGREPLVLGMFAATDNGPNLLRFFSDWTIQLRTLNRNGLNVREEGKPTKHYPVDLLLNGDMLFQSAAMGHAGSSAKKPSLYRLVDRDHLQQDHRYFVCSVH